MRTVRDKFRGAAWADSLRIRARHRSSAAFGARDCAINCATDCATGCAADADCAAPSHDECIDSHDFISATDIPSSVLEVGDSVLEGSTDGDPITAIV